jgi:hypothetical protein
MGHFKTLHQFLSAAGTQSEWLSQNQNWERSDQPYTQVQKYTQKSGFKTRLSTLSVWLVAALLVLILCLIAS